MYLLSILAILCLLYLLIIYDDSSERTFKINTINTTKPLPFHKKFIIKIKSLYLCVNKCTGNMYLSDDINEAEIFQMKLYNKKVILKSLSLKKYMSIKLTSRINQSNDIAIESVNKKDISCHLDLRKVASLGMEVTFFNRQKLAIDKNGLLYTGGYGSKVVYLKIIELENLHRINDR